MDSNAPYDARAVANFLLDVADDRRRSLGQISLLKILYFAHGWYLTSRRAPLISQYFEAWQHGPVVKVVRDAFKEYGAAPIKSRAKKLILQTGKLEEVQPLLHPKDADFITVVYEEYAQFGPWQLSDMTHEPGSPWHALWHSENAVGRLGLRIKNEDILTHFATIGTRKQLS